MPALGLGLFLGKGCRRMNWGSSTLQPGTGIGGWSGGIKVYPGAGYRITGIAGDTSTIVISRDC